MALPIIFPLWDITADMEILTIPDLLAVLLLIKDVKKNFLLPINIL